MPKTLKDKTLQAIRILERRFRKPVGRVFFDAESCALCRVYYNRSRGCGNCPLSPRGHAGAFGCLDTIPEAHTLHTTLVLPFVQRTKTAVTEQQARRYAEEFETCARLLNEAYKILERLPAERFDAPANRQGFPELENLVDSYYGTAWRNRKEI